MPPDDETMPSPMVYAGCLAFNLRWVTRVVTRHYDARLRKLGIKPTQIPILSRVAATDTVAMAELAEWLGMERTTLLRNLRPLERDGLVRRETAGGSRRVEIAITPAGRRKLASIYPQWKDAQKTLRDTLGAARWKKILADLEIAAERLGC